MVCMIFIVHTISRIQPALKMCSQDAYLKVSMKFISPFLLLAAVLLSGCAYNASP